ncbi:trp operon leader peptide [Salmonella enterica]
MAAIFALHGWWHTS